MAGYCKGGNCDSYWAIYLSNIGCLIFDDPLTISDYCKLCYGALNLLQVLNVKERMHT